MKVFFKSPKFCNCCEKIAYEWPTPGFRWQKGYDKLDGIYFECVTPKCGSTLFVPQKNVIEQRVFHGQPYIIKKEE